jgi:ribonuclease P protein component
MMPKIGVLSGSRNFSKVYSKGKSVGDRYVVVFYKKNGLDHNRLAFLASKKVGNAVARNRARRLMKESVRTMERIEKQGYDIIFIARKTINGTKCEQVQKSITKALKRTELR